MPAINFIKPGDFVEFKPFDYEREFKLSLNHVGVDKKEVYPYLFVKDYYFENNQKMDILLFIDPKNDKDWRANAPFVKAIADRDRVVDGDTINKRFVKYIPNSIYGKCKLAKVADFDKDGKDDYAISIITAKGQGASRQKALKPIGEGVKDLFKDENVHIMLDKDFEVILEESRQLRAAKKADIKESKKKFGQTTKQTDSVEDESASEG